MKKSFILLATAFTAFALLLSACSFDGVTVNVNTNTVKGSGNVVSEERTVSGFTRVELQSIGNLVITQGDTESLTIAADDNLLPYITTEVVAGTLEISMKPNTNVDPTKTIQYTLTVKSIASVVLAGFGNITADKLESNSLEVKVTGSGDIHIGEVNGETLALKLTGFGNIYVDKAVVSRPTLELAGSGDIKVNDLKASDLALTISGFGNATISGSADNEVIKLTGSGNYHGGDIQTKTAAVTISGFGNATAWATDSLNLKITGSGNVDYYGNPRLTQTITGFGNIKSLGEH